jgi:hypothetical protein
MIRYPRHTLPAGWRRGYAADCKSRKHSPEINTLGANSYQDKPATEGEPDKVLMAAFRAAAA